MGKNAPKEPTSRGYKTVSSKRRRDRRNYSSSAGFVLVVVLWAVAITSLVAASVSEITALSLRRQMLDIERSKYSYAARSACIHALREIVSLSPGAGERKSQEIQDSLKEETPSEALPITEEELIKGALEKTSKLKDEKRNLSSSSIPYYNMHSIKVGNVTCKTRINDEAGKLNLNSINEERKEYFYKFLLAAGVSSVEADIITDSVLDWLDKDDQPRPNGAERRYYQSLSRPYTAKNGPFNAVEELALVKGVTPAIYGLIRDKITIYGDKLNINYASREVLAGLPHMDLDLADKFIEGLEKRGLIKNTQELNDILFHLGISGSRKQDLMEYITLEPSPYLSIYSLAYGEKGLLTYRILVENKGRQAKILATYPDW